MCLTPKYKASDTAFPKINHLRHMYFLKGIAAILKVKTEGDPSQNINYLAVDSRKIFFPAETLFFALPSTKRDGHQFILEAYNQGVRSFVISHPIDLQPYAGASFIHVCDTLKALQSVAIFHRNQFNLFFI